ncbi:MAG TPA: glycogen/starch/alpha-glucan family phosphorylase [Candidatus Dorea intestinavium]|nr:glycogen/starch/alpha-glucan family phosphorylase [Candidatus Dorea intestinavium]
MSDINIKALLENQLNKSIKEASNREVFEALMLMTKELEKERGAIVGDKKLYYFSAEFLIGKLLSNNLINLGLYDEVAAVLLEQGKNLTDIEEIEPEPSLGNGGLGRLAACFLDSIATLGLPGDGIGLNYHCGLFKQVFKDEKQTEEPNPWIEVPSWLTKKEGVQFEVNYKDFSLTSTLYDIAVTGYHNGTNTLHLFDVDTVSEGIIKEGIHFDKSDIKRNLTLFLYPDDSDKAGELLRIYQQYFMVSCGAQLILKELEEKKIDLKNMADHVAIQINDTHPSMVIPELIRLLNTKGIEMDQAIAIVTKTCAYTNHTILAEALEKWPISYLEETVPILLPIIKELDQRVVDKYGKKYAIIDDEKRVHMAWMDIHYSHSTNGVAALHTEILKDTELKMFYDIYPEKFNNKTNGITFRRWLMHCNRRLSDFITEKIGDEWKEDALKLETLLNFSEDQDFLDTLGDIKKENKEKLKNYLKATQNIEIDENAIFDIQIKRLHEYKRQQMNALFAIYKYLDIKSGNKPTTPITLIFGAKAAPAYIIAKDIIHLLLCLSEIINNDPEVSPYLRLVMVENYNVTLAEKLIPACDISEQISLASKEASGTGNMKFMLNGAITLGTEDGANVEIKELVGEDNIFIFGAKSPEVIKLYETSGYKAVDYYIEDEDIRTWINFIISPQMLKIGDPEMLLRLHAELIKKDWFMTLLDLKDYIAAKERIYKTYEDKKKWMQMVVKNIAKAGYFSADRTIEEYNRDIWQLK